MITEIQLTAAPHVAYNENLLKQQIAEELSLKPDQHFSILPLKRSIDARSRSIKVNLKVRVFIDEPVQEEIIKPDYKAVSPGKKVVIIGAGPAGLFAALRCLALGIKPVIFERGKDVKARRRDLAAINKDHIVNPESNYCFGEGGAGTYSDGKLYTRSNKRGDVNKILRTLVFHGATPDILVDAHPHIGTNKLPQRFESSRDLILKYGGEIHFNSKLTDIEIKNNAVVSVTITAFDSAQSAGGSDGRGTQRPL